MREIQDEIIPSSGSREGKVTVDIVCQTGKGYKVRMGGWMGQGGRH